ncbi:sensor histidine kinase [Nibrella viscosa]
MKTLLFTFLFVLSGLTLLKAQPGWPPAFVITSDTVAYYRLDSTYFQILPDKTAQLTIEQVTSPAYAQTFQFSQRGDGTFGTVETYWYRFRLKNGLDHDVTLYFGNQLDYFELFTQDASGTWQRQRTGRRLPFNERDGLKASQAVPVMLRAGQEVVIFERWKDPAISYHFWDYVPTFTFEHRLWNTVYVDRLEKNREQTILLQAIFWGITLIMALYNLCIFLVVRERVYLYYTFFLLFFGFSRMPASVRPYLFPDFSDAIYYSQLAAYILTDLCLIQFIRSFLQTAARLPKRDTWLVRTAILWAVFRPVELYFTLNAFPSNETELALTVFFSATAYLIFIVLYVLIILVLVQAARRKYQGAKLLAGSIIPLFLLMILGRMLFYLLGGGTGGADSPYEKLLDNQYYTTEIIEGLATVWLVFLFSGALSQRYNQMRREVAEQALERERLEKEREIERNQLMEAQKAELERQVAERTAEVVAQKEEIEAQRDSLAKTLRDLQNTQTQLIHKEKMASLGELTAGIAHEIQNPLNFVNNFAESSVDLLEELQQGPIQTVEDPDKKEEAEELLEDLQQNLQRICHHGQRAGSIVKGMLEHSRAGAGEKTPTDLNLLAEEYLRLAYQNLRLKDESFEADLRLELDHGLEKVPVVAQEMGRVLLNLYNNAFYAVQEKARSQASDGSGVGFQPQVAVSTHIREGKVELRVKDNGTGIPEEILGKIYQPFFTTKPTGQGNTGLGLSLSYDIVTKGHGGDMQVETEEGQYTEMIVQIPVN